MLGRAAADAAMAAAVAIAHDRGATVTAALLIDGDPAEALLKTGAERDADLIVIGATTDITIAERLLGTVATEVVRRAPCEVLIVRPRPDTGDMPVRESETAKTAETAG